MRFTGERDLTAGYTYVGEQFATMISQYRTNNWHNRGPICQIPGPYVPQGMRTDPSGILYVTGEFVGDKFGVATFGPHCGKAGATYNDPTGTPDDLVLDGSTLYVSNLVDIYGQSAIIEVYNTELHTGQGPREPISHLSEPSVTKGIGVALDSRHNLFWSTTTQSWSGGEVVEFSGGKIPGRVVATIGSDFPGGVIIDSADKLLLVDQSNRSIYVFAPPYTAPPSRTIPLQGTTITCAMGLEGKRLYCLDYEYGAVDVYSYPAGEYVYSYTNGIDGSYDPLGIAIHR